jgi:hypothetical protein
MAVISELAELSRPLTMPRMYMSGRDAYTFAGPAALRRAVSASRSASEPSAQHRARMHAPVRLPCTMPREPSALQRTRDTGQREKVNAPFPASRLDLRLFTKIDASRLDI